MYSFTPFVMYLLSRQCVITLPDTSQNGDTNLPTSNKESTGNSALCAAFKNSRSQIGFLPYCEVFCGNYAGQCSLTVMHFKFPRLFFLSFILANPVSLCWKLKFMCNSWSPTKYLIATCTKRLSINGDILKTNLSNQIHNRIVIFKIFFGFWKLTTKRW